MFVPKPHPPAFTIARWFFSRALAVVFFCAFASLLPQVRGLMGAHGIVPAQMFLDAVWKHLGAEALWRVPTLCWLGAGDGALIGLCLAGLAVSLIMLAGIAPGGCALTLWALYLSLVSVGSPFLDFQWDALLLETALLAAFALPWSRRPHWQIAGPMARFGRWLLWWLLFRLMLESGLVKLESGDETWRNLSALDFHFATQPLPLWTAWYAHHAPRWVLRGAVLVMFVIELAVPFLIFAPRRWRHAGAWALIALQLAILATGNYAFFNLLTIVLCLLLFDDAAWPSRLRDRFSPPATPTACSPRLTGACAAVAAVLALLSASPLLHLVLFTPNWSTPFEALRSFNGYGLFAVMTTRRPEIVVEGSNDGVIWQAYEFPWKPGDLRARPRWVAPHQPRLDWQMWFAALGRPEHHAWFGNFLGHLLLGTPEVLDLLASNPFPKQPPRYVRAVLYEYDFTASSGDAAWWRRESKGYYIPPIALRRPEAGSADAAK